MNTRRYTIRREEGGVANERIPPCVGIVPIVGLEEENQEVPLQVPQIPPKPQGPQEPQVSPVPQAPFVEGDMTNVELRDAVMNLT